MVMMRRWDGNGNGPAAFLCSGGKELFREEGLEAIEHRFDREEFSDAQRSLMSHLAGKSGVA